MVECDELYFPSPGWRFYSQVLTLTLMGVGFLVWGLADLVVTPRNWADALPLLGAVYATGLGVAFILLTWFIFAYGTIVAWQDWRHLRPPAVVIDAAGAHYLAPRPALVPWSDIERVCLKRTIFPHRVISKVYLRLTPDAVLIRDGKVKIPANRHLNVGLLSEIDIPEYDSVQFLIRTSGAPLELEEIDRRPAIPG